MNNIYDQTKYKEMISLYDAILSGQYKHQEIWELIKSGEYAASPALIGNKYEDSDIKLMVIGRALNGWSIDGNLETKEHVIESILKTEYNFDDVINRDGFMSNGRKRKYYYSTSRFWKLIRLVLKEYGESNGGNWYDDGEQSHWNQKIVWSNIYKIAPAKGKNPPSSIMNSGKNAYYELVKKEIELYKPNHVLFVVGDWFDNERFSQFGINTKPISNTNGIVSFIGRYKQAKIIVCKRPDVLGTKDAHIERMAKIIHDTFDTI